MDSQKMKNALELLASEAGFLLDPKVKEAFAGMMVQDAEIATAESMLRVLGVSNEQELHELIRYFSKEAPLSDSGFSNGPLGASNSELPESLRGLQTLIKPDDVIFAVQRFIKDRKEGKIGAALGAASLNHIHHPQDLAAENGTNPSTNPNQGSLKAEERQFWDRMGSIIPEQHFHAWKQVEKHLQTYTNLLIDRGRVVDKISRLQKENNNLKELLNVYLADKINEKLLIPPTQTIHLDGKRGPAGAI